MSIDLCYDVILI